MYIIKTFSEKQKLKGLKRKLFRRIEDRRNHEEAMKDISAVMYIVSN